MFVILFFVVLLFEYDMKQNGGIFEMVKGSPYEGTFFLNFMLFSYLFVHYNLFNLDNSGNCFVDQVWEKSPSREVQQNPSPLGKDWHVGYGTDLYHGFDPLCVWIPSLING